MARMPFPDPWARHPLPRKLTCPERDPKRARVFWAYQHVKAAAAGHRYEQEILERATAQWLSGDWEKACRTLAYASESDSHEIVRAMAPVSSGNGAGIDYYEEPEDESEIEVAEDGSELEDGEIDW